MALRRAVLHLRQFRCQRHSSLAPSLQLQLSNGACATSSLARPARGSAAAELQRTNSLKLQQALGSDDHVVARALLAQLLQEGCAKPHHVTSVLRRCNTRDDVSSIAKDLDDPLRARLAGSLHDAWAQQRDFGLGAAALAYGVRSGAMPLDTASKIAVRTLRGMQRRRAKAAVQRAYVKELSKAEGIGTLPFVYAALFSAARELKDVQAAAFQLQQEKDASRRLQPSSCPDELGGEVAWLAMHKAWIRFGHAREAAVALVQAVPAEPGATSNRLAATATNGVLQLLGQHESKDDHGDATCRSFTPPARPTSRRSIRAKQRRLWKRARAYLVELSQSDTMTRLLSAAHFNPLAKLCGSREEVEDLLELMEQVSVQADATTFSIMQELGLKLGDGKQTAETLKVAVFHGALCPLQAGQIAASSLAAAVQGQDEVARLEAWAYYKALTHCDASDDASVTETPMVARLPTEFFNVLLNIAWRPVDVVAILGSMADVSAAPDRSTYIALHAALLRLGECEGAAAALARGVTSGTWELAAGAGATATLTLKEMIGRDKAAQARDHHGQRQRRQRRQQQQQDDEEDEDEEEKCLDDHMHSEGLSNDLRQVLLRQPLADEISTFATAPDAETHDHSAHSKTDAVQDSLPLQQIEAELRRPSGMQDLDKITKTERGLRDAFVYLRELTATGCARVEHFTVVAQGCRNSKSELEALELLQDLLRDYDKIKIDDILQNALKVAR